MDHPTITILFQYGLIGVFVVVLGIVARTMVVREQNRADRLEGEVRRLHGAITRAVNAITTAPKGDPETWDYDADPIRVQRRALAELEQWWQEEQERKKDQGGR